jgi:hypothetical protein
MRIKADNAVPAIVLARGWRIHLECLPVGAGFPVGVWWRPGLADDSHVCAVHLNRAGVRTWTAA